METAAFRSKFRKELQGNYTDKEIELAFDALWKKHATIGETERGKVLNGVLQIALEEALQRLKKNEPLEYIMGEGNFYGRSFEVNNSVHVPRPETETMVNWVLQDYKNISKSGQITLLDIGTGAGVLPITFAKEMPEATVMAMDISEEVLNLAQKNAERHKAIVEFLKSDLFSLKELPEELDVIVSNPPYILRESQKDVQRNFLAHEPEIALYVEDNDPMIFNRKIAELSKSSLKEGGAVYVEINQYLRNESKKVFQKFGYRTECRKDLFGNFRILKAFK